MMNTTTCSSIIGKSRDIWKITKERRLGSSFWCWLYNTRKDPSWWWLQNKSFRYLTTGGANNTTNTETKESDGKKQDSTEQQTAQKTTETEQSPSKESESQQEEYGWSVEDLVQQIQEKEQQIAQLRELSLRAYAEMENVRKIAQRDVENARKYSIGAFAKDLLDVADNLERALQSIPKEKLDTEKGDAVVVSLYEGVKATNNVLQKVFQRYGIERYDPKGEKFDPNLHQAMFEIPDESSSGVVLAVAKTGYKIQDRILRPAEVGVSKVIQKGE